MAHGRKSELGLVAWCSESLSELRYPRNRKPFLVDVISIGDIISQWESGFGELQYRVHETLSGHRFTTAVRGQGEIEALHRAVDVTFREAEQTTAERKRANKLGWLRRFANASLKRIKDPEASIPGRMPRAGWNRDTWEQVLFGI